MMAESSPDTRKAALLDKLREYLNEDPETGHMAADNALLEYIGDSDITDAFEALHKWYA